MIDALHLSSKGERTQQAYVREVHLFSKFYKKSPTRISEAELQKYFLHRKNVDHLAPNSMRICYSGIKFFYQHVLGRDWHTLSLIRAQTERRLPTVLSAQDVRRLLKAATPLHNQVYFTALYSLGLRLQEAFFLQPPDIDSTRMMIHVHRGKGAKDRYVPLPHDTLVLLRHYWKTHRNKTWLFAATGRDQKQMATAIIPISIKSSGALSPIYRAIFKDLMAKAGRLEHLDPQLWKTPWNVHSQANPNGHTAFKYLAPYVFKIAISNQRIVSLKGRTVTFAYRKPGSTRPRTTQLDAIEFIRRFLQHVLPQGFIKVRHFGFMNATCTIPTDTVRHMILTAHPSLFKTPQDAHPAPLVASWPTCGKPMQLIMRRWTSYTNLVDTG